MSDKVIQVYKKCGQTPLECINELKNNHPELKHVPVTYAGRLDPLAEGVLVLLLGDECLKKDEYLALPKVYEVEILFGFATDTYDLMGEVVASSVIKFSGPRTREDEVPDHENSITDFAQSLQKILGKFTGRINQKYPVYSSRTVKGKPLYKWAREGKLNEIEIPSHDVYVEKIELIDEGEIDGYTFHQKIKNEIGKVKGDFRQDKILKIWDDILKSKKEEKYKVIKLRIVCGSGVYVRSIANEIGVVLGVPSLALSIKRTKVGEYKIN